VLAISSVTLLLATLGIVLLPAAGVAWAALDGLALGTIFPLCMAAIVDFGRDAQEVTHATGLMLGGGYLIAAAGPVVLGALRDATGSFTVGVGMLAGVSLALVGVCTAMVRSPGPAAGASAPSD
jgi:CP family cyanate transporter-like MFS transporter